MSGRAVGLDFDTDHTGRVDAHGNVDFVAVRANAEAVRKLLRSPIPDLRLATRSYAIDHAVVFEPVSRVAHIQVPLGIEGGIVWYPERLGIAAGRVDGDRSALRNLHDGAVAGIARVDVVVGVESHAQHEAACVRELDDLLVFDVDPVYLAGLATRVGVAVHPPGDPLRVVQALHKYGYLCVVIQQTHGSSLGTPFPILPGEVSCPRSFAFQHESVVEEGSVNGDSRTADVSGLVAAEEHHQVGDFLRVGLPAGRHSLESLRLQFGFA